MTLPSGDGQLQLFAPSNSPLVVLDENHRLVRLAEMLDWTELERIAQQIRRKKLKSRRGRRPNLRALIGAVVLMGTRKMTYREAEDQIRHYGPARFLCGLTDSTWSPDHTTIQDFTELMGEDGMVALNEHVLKSAHQQGLLELKLAVGDTTAQEAHMSYPTEIGLMAGFLGMISTAARRAGKTLKQCARDLSEKLGQANRLVRKYRFFDKSKDARVATGKRLLSLTNSIKKRIEKALSHSRGGASKLKKSGKVARRKLETLVDSMTTLSPQIKYWLDTGWVAKKKLINLLMPEVCSIPRGKVGKDTEFGLKWGLTRFEGGFLLGHAGADRGNFNDKKHVEESVTATKELFGQAPHAYAYDRGGYSEGNVRKLSELGVKQVGLTPSGSAKWEVDEKNKRKLCRRRVEVEGSIGALKSGRYAFNRPNVRSTAMMLTAGQRSILGYNLNRLLQRTAERDDLHLIGA